MFGFPIISPLQYVVRPIVPLHSFRLKLCSVKYIVHCFSHLMSIEEPTLDSPPNITKVLRKHFNKKIGHTLGQVNMKTMKQNILYCIERNQKSIHLNRRIL